MSNLPKVSQGNKPKALKSTPYQGQPINNERFGDGFIWLINIQMNDGEEIRKEAIVRFYNDPPGHVRTWRFNEYSPLMIA